MNEAKHTPTPWAVEDPMGSDIGLWIVQAGLQTFAWSCIATVVRDDEDTRSSDARFIDEDEQKANADFIVKAVNSHDALVEALRWVRANYASGSTKEINERISVALSQAGETP